MTRARHRPSWARRLVTLVTDSRTADHFLGDLEEEFEAIGATAGRARARRWYAGQVLRSIPHLALLGSRTADHRTGAGMSWRADLHDAWRRSRRAPVFTATIVLTLALGIGATTATWSVVRGVLLKALPFPEPERIVQLFAFPPGQPDFASNPLIEINQWRESARSYEALGAIWWGGTTRTITLPDRTTRELVAVVTKDFDRALGVRLLHGRPFRDDEYAPGGPKAVLLTEAFWRREFGGDSSVVGRSIEVADTMRTVVGVLADAGTEFPEPGTTLWIPVAAAAGSNLMSPGMFSFRPVARLRPGVSIEQAEAELKILAARSPKGGETRSARVVSLRDQITGPVRPTLIALTGAVLAALLVACGNVAILLLARAQSRHRELAVRAALGCDRTRLGRGLAIEAALTAGAGGVLGVLLARPLIDVFLRFYPGRLIRTPDIAVDGAVLAGAVLATAAATLVTALPAMRRAWRLDLVNDLRDGASTAGRGSIRMRRLLVGTQLALAVALILCGGLLVRSFVAVAAVAPGFDARDGLFVSVTASPARYAGLERLEGIFDEVQHALRAMPGVIEVASVNYLPFPGRAVGYGTQVSRPETPDEEVDIQYRMSSPTYPAAMGIAVLRGRGFTEADVASSAPVALINQSLARAAFGGRDPIGQRLEANRRVREIVGVIADTRYWGLERPVTPELHAPYHQEGAVTSRIFVVRTHTPSADAARMTIAAVRGVDARLAVGTPGTLEHRLDQARAPSRFRALLIGGLAFLSLILAALGLYAVMAFAVTARTREIGIRLALGASARRIHRDVLAEALRIAVPATAAGLVAGLAAARTLRGFLVEVSASDPLTVVAVIAGFLALASVAALLPARHASRIAPQEALRHE